MSLRYNWLFWARDNQLMPDELLVNPMVNTWLILAGRGYGKTRTGAETVKWLVEHGGYKNVMIVGRTAGDVRQAMIQGSSGLLAAYPPWNQPNYQPSTRTIEFPNGAIAITRSADEPDGIRGPNTDLVWGDELAAWRYVDAYDQIQFGNRIGEKPLQIYTTTPRPTALIRMMVDSDDVITRKGTMYENIDNLALSAVSKLIKKYQHTRLGRQELLAEILDDTPGALWTRKLLEKCYTAKIPQMRRVIVAVDPAISSGEESNETGIIVVGLGEDGYGYILDDVSVQGTPDEWARKAVFAFDQWKANLIVAEDNQGGEMVEYTLKTIDKRVPVKRVHAKRGKYLRAEPVAALYEQGKVKHYGSFATLEDQQCTWVAGEDSPDRLDAAVHGLTELMLGASNEMKVNENPFWD